MTIAAAFLTSEGVVLGADSTLTAGWAPDPALVLAGLAQHFDHGQKVFQIGPEVGGRFGLCFYGLGRVGLSSQRTIAARVTDRLRDHSNVEHARDALVAVVGEEIERAARAGVPASTDQFGYFVGGWDPDTHEPGCFDLFFEGSGALVRNDRMSVGQGRFEGAPYMYDRVFKGMDQKTAEAIAVALDAFFTKMMGQQVPGLKDGMRSIVDTAVSSGAGQGLGWGYMDMPIREAIDYVHMYLHLTVKSFKFRRGAPICGGPIEIAFITTDRPFRWALHKPFESAVFQEEIGWT